MDSAPPQAEQRTEGGPPAGRAPSSQRFPRRGIERAVAGTAAIALVAVVIALVQGGGPAPLPLPGIGKPAPPGDPFAYRADREGDFVSRATAGSAGVLFAKSPGGVLATAARVAAFRPQIDAAVSGSGVDPASVESIVFLESAGRPNVLAGADPSAAAGLTQILAQTGESLLGMHIDLSASRRLTRAIDNAAALGSAGTVTRLQRQRAKIDDRFNSRLALAATVRYLRLARQRLGRDDLAVVSYHMGIGNLQNVLGEYNGGQSVPYPQLYFDTAPDRHAAAFKLLQGFGDDSSLYYWRVLGARTIMHLYRTDRAALTRLIGLETAGASTEQVLHPPDRTASFAGPGALRDAYGGKAILPLPANPAELGLLYDPGMGSASAQVGAPAALYRGLRPAALDLLVELAARVRALSGGHDALTVTSTVRDRAYEAALGATDTAAVNGYSPQTTGYAFEIARAYSSRAQAVALQSMLDRLQALNLIAWVRLPAVIQVTVASDASQVIVSGP
jgi:hypothetical protein